MSEIRFADLFSGIGGIRQGFELACRERGISAECVFTSEIKPHALKIIKQNHPGEETAGDITKADEKRIPDFDVLLAGFPCQAFSTAGKRLGFEDTRGTLFFDVARILKEKRPEGFLLENVEGLVVHDRTDRNSRTGRTLQTILDTLEDIGYRTSWRVLNASGFGIPQERKRIYITGTLKEAPDLDGFPEKRSRLKDILEHGLPVSDHPFVRRLLEHYTAGELAGKAVNDKRGGKDNIHSWDIGYRGDLSEGQKGLMDAIMTQRRKKKWSQQYGISRMDGVPLTEEMIRSFYGSPEGLHEMLEDLVRKHYLTKERPKKKEADGRRVQDMSLPEGYNITAGKMSFEVSRILSPEGTAPALTAMDMCRLYVPDGDGIRRLSFREGLRLFGYPEDFMFEGLSEAEGYDLLGNTVCVPVIKAVAGRLLNCIGAEI